MPDETTPVTPEVSTTKQDTFSYKGWMNSDSFLKRAFGVFGYSFVAGLIVQAIFMALFMIALFAFGGFAMIFGLLNR